MFAILVDVTKCTGCEKCVEACVQAHDQDLRKAAVDRVTTKDGLSANRFCTVLQAEPGRFARKSCMHCLEPSCVAACLVGSLTKTPEGAVVYDPAKCIGCRYCMLACPFHIPRYQWESITPFVMKCDLCIDRLREGKVPACVEACPHGALSFGERQAILDLAHLQVTQTDCNYLPRIWGEEEYGGTSVLYLSDVDLDCMGWPADESVPIPEITEPLITRTPHIGLGVLAGLFGLKWIIDRRTLLMDGQQEAPDPEENATGEVERDE